MHGGATKGGGAPKGNQNALKSGLYTAEMKKLKQLMREIGQEHKELLSQL